MDMNKIQHQFKMHRKQHSRHYTRCIVLACVALSAPTTVWAIPSPDLVINLSASVAQLLGLISVVFGSFALSGNKSVKKHTKKRTRRSGQVVLGVIGTFLLASIVTNVLQYTKSVDYRNERLQTNLVRKSIENGSVVGDTNLKTLSFSDQKNHSQGISTDTLAEWLEQKKPLHIIDVREDEEFETGSIQGAAHVRYPDVLANASMLENSGNTLFLCYSGNRSSELCNEFTAQGKSCNFMVGGYEKWLSESRPLNEGKTITSADLRQLPDFKNKNTLLDTPDVHTLVQEENATFLDVRYPGDFVKNHLPGAINITMRALGTTALDERIAGLPDTPFIGACYDKRSCFYAQLIGLRLERAGKDYRGRYTVPQEYYEAPANAERAHVSQWKQQQQVSLGSFIITPLSSVLNKLVDMTGHYALGLLSLVFLVRLALLPLALKAERDTVVQKSLKGRIDKLKVDLADHPRALTDATLALYKKYKIRPIINILASLGQLGFMLLFFSAVTKSAPGWSHSFAWLNAASSPDPLLVFPIVASALFVLVLAMQSPPKTKLKATLFALGGIAMFALLFTLNAAANLYLIISMAFLIGQSVLFKAIGNARGWSEAGSTEPKPIEDTGVVPLSKAHFLPQSTGKKAARLGELIEAGYNVPDGFVFTSVITNNTRTGQDLDKSANALPMDKAQNSLLSKQWKRLKTKRVAVRSSGANEDGEDNSFAGVYESILNVKKDELSSAVAEVYSSLSSDRSDAYTQKATGSSEVDQGGVVVQKMVPAEYAGVMFTEHPGNTGAIMIEMVSGLGEDLVSGNVTPDSYAFGRLSDTFMPADSSTNREPPVKVAPLLQIGREIEKLFDHPQDIEWAYAKGKFYILQARNITRSVAQGSSIKNLAENERRRLVQNTATNFESTSKKLRRKLKMDDAAFVQNELSELLPRPTPVSADMMHKLWAAGGSTDLACQMLGIPYDVNYSSAPFIETIFGWLYVNKHEEKRRLSKGPGAMATFELARQADRTEAEFRNEFLPQFMREMTERNAVQFDQLSLKDAIAVLDRWVERFVEETYVQAEIINISADYYVKTAMGKLASAKLDANAYLNSNEETVVSKAMELLREADQKPKNIVEFLSLFGHRAPLDYELSASRFSEDPDLVRQYISRSSGSAAPEAHTELPLPNKKVLAISVQRARTFQVLKEEAKHYCLMELAQIRELLLAIDKLANFDGAVFHLKVEELATLSNRSSLKAMRELAQQRVETHKAWAKIQLPSTLSVLDIESIDMLTGQVDNSTATAELNGNRVAGDAEVTGTVRVITDVSEISSFKQGEILVARMTDPTWYPLFSQASGIITDVGGWLSHAAIVAREFDLPAIVGATAASNQLKTGDIVCMKLDGSIERVENRRDGESAMRQAESETPEHNAVASIDTAEIPVQTAQQLSSQAAANNDVVANTEVKNAEADMCQIYELDEVRMQKMKRRIDRRATKGQIGDRRSSLRLDANGEPQRDRRAANRAANIEAFRRTNESQGENISKAS